MNTVMFIIGFLFYMHPLIMSEIHILRIITYEDSELSSRLDDIRKQIRITMLLGIKAPCYWASRCHGVMGLHRCPRWRAIFR
ncbi:hypothetical protein V8C37DRAFT_394965 [Trichoderma ceciliae]